MKRVLGIALALVTLGFVGTAEAKADASHENSMVVAASSAPQWGRNYRHYDRRWNRRYNRQRSVTRTRMVRYGRRLYRETYLVTYWPNGRTQTRLISRSRIG